MKVITEPTVKLVTRTSVDWRILDDFLFAEGLPPVDASIRGKDHTGAAVVEIAARLCYMSFGRGRRDIADFITNLLASKDGSVLEHVNYGFVITGISRSLTHEFVRHRAGFAYSQRSQRYVDEAEANFVVPPTVLKLGTPAINAFERGMEQLLERYNQLVGSITRGIGEDRVKGTEGRKIVRQAARSVLPNATETKLFVTGNVRAWRHFIEMRATKFADLEIRRLAVEILRQLQAEEPLLFGDFVTKHLPDGSEVATPEYSKV